MSFISQNQSSNVGRGLFASPTCQASHTPLSLASMGAIAKHYKVDPASLHKTLLDFICVCGNAEREGRRIGNG